MTKKVKVTRWQVEVAQAKVEADIAMGKPVDPFVRMIAEAGRDTSPAARAS